MKTELEQLKEIVNKLIEYDDHNISADQFWRDGEIDTTCYDEAYDFQKLAEECLVEAVLLARKYCRNK